MSTTKITNAATPRHTEQIRVLGEFLDLEEIVYEDHGDRGEDYTLVSLAGRRLTLKIRGNRVDGPFLTVEKE